MNTKKSLAVAAALLAATTGLTACGDEGGGAGSTGAGSASVGNRHNQADTTFAQAMIPHHGQAIDMAKMARAHAASPRVKTLASAIEEAQGPEIDKMAGWLKAWGEDVPATDMEGMPGMDPGGSGGMPGTMSTQQMDHLGSARGADFDRMFLQMMIRHHQGALQMAKAELADGRNAQAVALARSIEASQSAEIAKMRQMLHS